MTKNNKKKVAIVSNTTWSIYNYRQPLIKDLNEKNCEVYCISPKDKYVSKIEGLVKKYIDLDLCRKSINPFNEIISLAHLFEIYKSLDFDYVCHFTIKPVIYGTIAARLSKVNNVINMITGRGYVFGKKSKIAKIIRIPVKLLYKYIMQYSKLIIFQNPEDQEYFFKEKLVDNHKTRISYGSGVDTEFFSYSSPKINKTCSFLFLGRLLYEKGVLELIKASQMLKDEFQNVDVNILGIVDEKNPNGINKTTIKKWESKGEVNFLDERDDVRPIIKKNDVVVLPSYYNEGVPRSLLEAMSIGRPIITTDWPGCRETVINNKNGLLVPVKNHRALYRAMKYLVENPKDRVKMGRQSRKIAEKKFNVELVNNIYLQALNL